jgi:glycosyltransferase involved in cell wall biosynthesis
LRNEPDALILAYNEPALAGFAPDRTVVRFDWTTPLPRYWNWPLWLPRFRRALYLFPSESERQLFLNRHPQIPRSRALVIPNAVDLELFLPAKRSRGLPSGAPIRIGFAGQWSPEKGIEQLLGAFADLQSVFPAAQLVLAGGPGLWKRATEAPGAREATALIRAMEAKGLLHCVGTMPRGEMPQFWNSVDIAVVPSLIEPFGLVALEALACGVPVVASAIGGLKDIVIDGECGLLVPPGDAAALSRALSQLVTNESLRLRFAVGARRRAQDFSLQFRSRQLLQFLMSATRNRTSAAQPSNESSLLAR